MNYSKAEQATSFISDELYGDFEDLETGETHDVDDVTSSEDEAEEEADDSEKKEGEDEPRKNKPLLHFCDCHCVANLQQKTTKSLQFMWHKR